MPTIEAFYLGVRDDLDPDESNYDSENASDLVGVTFGAGGVQISDGTDAGDANVLFGGPNETPLYESIVSLTLDDVDGDGYLDSNDNLLGDPDEEPDEDDPLPLPPENLSYEGG